MKSINDKLNSLDEVKFDFEDKVYENIVPKDFKLNPEWYLHLCLVKEVELLSMDNINVMMNAYHMLFINAKQISLSAGWITDDGLKEKEKEIKALDHYKDIDGDSEKRFFLAQELFGYIKVEAFSNRSMRGPAKM